MTWLWALGALAFFGIATPVIFGIAGAQTRKRSWLVAAVIYAILSWGGVALAIATESDSTPNTLAGLVILAAWVGGAVHAFLARPEYARRLNGRESALERARAVVARREEAQRLAEHEPRVAVEMGLGRPDLPGADDMGVIDVNHAPASALAMLPGLDADMARTIVRYREQIDGFSSVADLGGVAELPADTVEALRPFVVFLPR